MQNLILNFPEGYAPREKQVITLKKIQEAMEDGKKFIIVHADTGIGKSFIPKTLANIAKEPSYEFIRKVQDYTIYDIEYGPEFMDGEDPFGCYTLTITKSLQDQYQNTFKDTGILKGQSNYQCVVDDSVSVDMAPCLYSGALKSECWRACRCPYYSARNEMMVSKFAALNYSMFFSLPEHLRKREIIVCDEGSELEDQLVSQFTCEVDIPFLMKVGVMMISFPSEETPAKVREWLGKISFNVQKSLEAFKQEFKDGRHSKDHITLSKKKSEYTRLNNFFNSLVTLNATYFDSQYIIEKVDKVIRFIPLKVDVLSKYLFDYAETVIIMSATIIDPKAYCKSLGIKDYEYIHVDTDFDPEKSPIHIMKDQKLNFGNQKAMLPVIMDQIRGLLDHHKGEKGIIHTHTQYITDYVKNNIKSSRLLCREPGVRNEELLEIHEQSDDDTVLVSPSMTYGVDLKGDLGKFQIIIKAPWLPTKDVRVEKLMKVDRDWYSNAMLKTVVQAAGRTVRDDTDESVTYILDGSVFDAIARNKQKLPKFFLDRFQ